MIVSRFNPTANTGPLHIGNLFAATVTKRWVEQVDGEFFIKCDWQRSAIPQTQQDKYFNDNIRLLGEIFPDHRIITSRDEKYRDIMNPLYRSAVMDADHGVTDIIRGHDWSDSLFAWRTDAWTAAEYSFVHQAAVEKMTGSKIHVHFIPLLTDGGKKIAKSECNELTNLQNLIDAFGLPRLMDHVSEIIGTGHIDLGRIGEIISMDAGLDRLWSAKR